MTNFPAQHPVWLWVYFGVLGTAALVLLALILRNRMTVVRLTGPDQAGRPLTFGLVLLFASGWVMCGVAGPPGNLIGNDPAARNVRLALWASLASMAMAVAGWALVLVHYRALARRARGAAKEGRGDG